MFEPSIIIATASLLGLIVIAASMLRGWHDWLELKRSELDRETPPQRDEGSTMGAARIEIADLKERIRKLEAIASGVDL